jgi:ABC-type dipeptide/oligopeptide/nickel transport system permease component
MLLLLMMFTQAFSLLLLPPSKVALLSRSALLEGSLWVEFLFAVVGCSLYVWSASLQAEAKEELEERHSNEESKER